jgi:hypothetical protein
MNALWLLKVIPIKFFFFRFFNNKKSLKSQEGVENFYLPFCVPAKITKLIGLKRPPFLSPTNIINFACTQNGELRISGAKWNKVTIDCIEV